MKVMKFGGTSIGSPERMKLVADIVVNYADTPSLIVLSALSGTTTALHKFSYALANNERNRAKQGIDKLENFYIDFVSELIDNEENKKQVIIEIGEQFNFLRVMMKISYSNAMQKDIVAQGELLSTKLFSAYLQNKGIHHALLPALDFMQIDSDGEPLIGNIKVKLTQLIQAEKSTQLFITQGSVCRNHRGEMDNLKRGGSDYSASLISAAINATVCEIWTDIKGMQNIDPGISDKTIPLENLSFEEAAELTYFSAKILHPTSIWPAFQYNIPVRLQNILDPSAQGTTISKMASGVEKVKAIAARDNIIAISIKSSRMLQAHGFLKKIFNVFDHFTTPIDMVNTSEISVTLTIDNKENLQKIVGELETFGEVKVEENLTIVLMVGSQILQSPQLIRTVFSSLGDIPIRMVSYGGGENNISLLINTDQKVKVLQALNKGIFG